MLDSSLLKLAVYIIIYCIDINYKHCLSTKKSFQDVKLANNDLTTSFATLTEKCFSEHEKSVIQNILLS